ncbi:MAG: hypothetical protein ABSB78_06330 [Bacteroidota bacterium]
MSQFKKADLSKVKTVSIKKRGSRVKLSAFAKVYNPKKEAFSSFVRSLPRILIAGDLRKLVDDIVNSRKKNKPVILMIGAHVIKVGLSPVVIDLIGRGMITAVAMNSAASIHDVETAMWGETSEDVAVKIEDGSFGMSRETGEFINGVLERARIEGDMGYGEALGNALLKAPKRKYSILAACVTHGVPVTVHAAIGTDTIHQQPSMSGAVTGELSFRDFRVLCEVVKGLRGGGVVLNVGSAVIMPEVFLKSLTVARNLGFDARGFTTANFDMLQHYRPRVNVVQRPTQKGGWGVQITGHHEIMIPLLAAMIKQRM